MMSSILVVDDEAMIREMLHFNLSRHDFTVLQAKDTAEARYIINKDKVDLILLDIMLPGQSGTEFARELRNTGGTADLPIIMLTAKDSDRDKITGLDIGADDYITKPFSPAELIARINSLLRRVKIDKKEPEHDRFMDLTYNALTVEIICKQQKLDLSPLEIKLLAFFISKPERVYSRSQLLDQVWGQDVYIEERTVDVNIRRLRKILEAAACEASILTVRGMGYRLTEKKT